MFIVYVMLHATARVHDRLDSDIVQREAGAAW